VQFKRKTSAEATFQARDLLEPVVVLVQEPGPARTNRVPTFLTPPGFFRHRWSEMLGLALSNYPTHLTNASTQLFRQIPVIPRRFSIKPLTASMGLHIIGILCLPYLLVVSPFSSNEANANLASTENVVYYRFTVPSKQQRFPKILPPGPGSIPGKGSVPGATAVRGATAAHGTLFAVSRPHVPDNNHQSVLQSRFPPDLRLEADLKLPNLVTGNPAVPKVPLPSNPKGVRPLLPVRPEVVTVAPTFKTTSPTDTLRTALLASNHQPRLAIPLGAASSPILTSGGSNTGEDAGAPEFLPDGQSGQGLLVLGTDPAEATASLAIPPGNRFGEFSIAPGGNGSGSPGGKESGDLNGDSGGSGSGRNGAAGVGNGRDGGGKAGTSEIVGLRGGGDSSESLGEPDPVLIQGMVFPLPKLSGQRHSALIISAGPVGGGGLGVYGALHCGKIYTVLLPTSAKNWTLQYCQTPSPGSGRQAGVRATTTIVHVEQPLVPPEAQDRFDFKRTLLPPEKSRKLIILKGVIKEDGVVGDLKIHEGLSSEMDAAALRAFSQWTFKPAMRDGKPVSVDILVGIPSDGPGGVTNAAVGLQGQKSKVEEVVRHN